MTPEEQARVNIDTLLEQAGWAVQDAAGVNLYAASGVAVREFSLKPGHGTADYLLYVNQEAAGVVEAKPEGSTLTGVELQSEKYSTGLPDNFPAHQSPLPFLYESTGVEDAVHQQAGPGTAKPSGLLLPCSGDIGQVDRRSPKRRVLTHGG